VQVWRQTADNQTLFSRMRKKAGSTKEYAQV
jgi:hypothetical protein